MCDIKPVSSIYFDLGFRRLLRSLLTGPCASINPLAEHSIELTCAVQVAF